MSSTADNSVEANKLSVGEGVAIRDAVLVANSVSVDGMLEGDIEVANLLVSRTGTIRGRISVTRNAEIFGRVQERLDVKGLLILRSTSRIEGIVSYGRLSIEQGATIVGEISSADHPVAESVEYAEQEEQAEQSSQPEQRVEVRSGNGIAPLRRLDLSVLELMPGPIAATS